MPTSPAETTVLVTGATGFIAKHCILQLLEEGYQVRATVRSVARAETLRTTLVNHTAVDGRLTYVTADLTEDEGWAEAVEGCPYVLHLASPFPLQDPINEDDLIIPAREGTLRVLRVATGAGVERLVLTSSTVAVTEGHPRDEAKIFDENDWSIVDGDISAYAKSKTLAERAAWDFMDSLDEKNGLELAVINPGLVLGPLLDSEYGTSGSAIQLAMAASYPAWPRFGFAPVDVRDVAAAHLAAMTTPQAAGKRFLCATEHVWLREIAEILSKHFSARGYSIPTRQLPDFAVRIVALFDGNVRATVRNLGQRTDIDNTCIKQVLGWQPRSLEEMVIAMAESMIRYGVV